MSNIKIILTEDGSHSLYNSELNETYHSFHGAVQESKHVFIKEGLDQLKSKFEGGEIRVLEIGFGTGLNALLASQWAKENRINVHFTSLEPFPLAPEIYEALNYHQFFKPTEVQREFLQLHTADWQFPFKQHAFFTLLKSTSRLQDFVSENAFDIIFFDAFAPSKQSEMWSFDVLEKTFGFLSKGGILVTYCAKGQLKRDLKALGMEVETLPGPPGKKEMVRSLKN